ncbi:helix-turn-helix domain-containing protein [Symbioplanes lichenis]|uniref:helix-turn-helix domain-containing protein n=1 Tax=Symbioplanes lichenis TaxID=1629072 RepID=UPI0027388246|nr:helix-turn-helix transcriptional regulator [Actinoplanes lichenis]
MLGRQLRLLREAAGISPVVASRHVGSPSKVSRIESGKSRVKESDLHVLMDLYSVTGRAQRQALLEYVSRLNSPQWWHSDRAVLVGSFCSYLLLESMAQTIRTYEVRFIPGLLQTPAYAAALIGRRYDDEREIRRRVDIRQQRQRTILQGNVRRLWALVDHAALEETFAGRKVMREQIEFLIEAAQRPSVVLQVVPSGAGGRRGIATSFSILRQRIEKLADVIYIEHIGDPLFFDTPAQSDPYRTAMEELSLDAGKPEDTLKHLHEALNRL